LLDIGLTAYRKEDFVIELINKIGAQGKYAHESPPK